MEWHDIREASHRAAASAAGLVAFVSDADLATPGLGTWDVRGLIGHLSRAMQNAIDYLAAPAPAGDPLPSAASYYVAYLEWRDESPTNADRQVADRGAAVFARATASEIQTALVDTAATLTLIDDEPDDRLVSTGFGPMRIADYMRTRNLEMVTHTLDLARALDRHWEIDLRALRDALDLLTDIAVATGRGPALLFELTGRAVEATVLPILR